MARKPKFALEMKDGRQVRSGVAELVKYFDPEKLKEHFLSGKLAKWLYDRYYDEIAAEVEKQDKENPELLSELVKIFGVDAPTVAESQKYCEAVADKAYEKKDYVASMKNYTLAAELGSVGAMRSIGVLYYQGEGVTQDISRAIKWFEKAANLGDTESMNILADMHNEGEEVPQDTAKTEMWHQKANRDEKVKQMPEESKNKDNGKTQNINTENKHEKSKETLPRSSETSHSDALKTITSVLGEYVDKTKKEKTTNKHRGDMSRLNDSQKDVIQSLKQEGYNDTSLAEIITKYEQNDRLVVSKAMYWGDKYRYYLPIGGSKRDNAESVIYYIGKYLGKW